MKPESEMLKLITHVAQQDVRIRAAYIEGSRANPKAPVDMFQDYDICFIVNETESFQHDKQWLDIFGERLFMQCPEDSPYYPSNKINSYGWLIVFKDGNRLDLHVKTKTCALHELELYKVLVDKDNIFSQCQQTSDEMYWTKKPTKEHFFFTCNEFWWCLNNIAKGQWRHEIPYTMYMLNSVVRPMLTRVLEWQIADDHDYKTNVGKLGRYFKDLLSEDIYQRYLATFSSAQAESIWQSLFIMCDLFDEVAPVLADKLGYHYDFIEAKGSRQYLDAVYQLTDDAQQIF